MSCDHWMPMPGCKPPMNATWLIVQLEDMTERRAHWADGGGEEQPRFRGWFEDWGPGAKHGFSEISGKPGAWRHERGSCTRCGGELPVHQLTLAAEAERAARLEA